MTKSELIEKLAESLTHLSPREVELSIKEILEMMAQTLAKGERIEIRGFGTFFITKRKNISQRLSMSTIYLNNLLS